MARRKRKDEQPPAPTWEIVGHVSAAGTRALARFLVELALHDLDQEDKGRKEGERGTQEAEG